MEKLLASLGAPINPAQIGVSSELVEDAVILAKEVRDRFTLLQVLWDTRLLDEYAKEFVCEAHRRDDLIRFNVKGTNMNVYNGKSL